MYLILSPVTVPAVNGGEGFSVDEGFGEGSPECIGTCPSCMFGDAFVVFIVKSLKGGISVSLGFVGGDCFRTH